MEYEKKVKLRCKNCGDETVFPSNAVGERVSLGWCVSCHKALSKKRVSAKTGEEYWTDGRSNRNYFTSRPNHPSKDS